MDIEKQIENTLESISENNWMINDLKGSLKNPLIKNDKDKVSNIKSNIKEIFECVKDLKKDLTKLKREQKSLTTN